MVVRADSAARKRSQPSAEQDTLASADRHGSGPVAVNGRGNVDGANGADLPGEVTVVDLDDADGVSESLEEGDLEDFDELSVDDVESLAVVELDEAEVARRR